MSPRRARYCLLACLLVLLPPVLSAADEIVHRSGKKYRGYPRRVGAEIHLNEYGCSAPEMTLGVRRLRALDVREIRPQPIVDHLQRRLEELSPSDVTRRIDLLREAQSARLKPWVERIAAEILTVQPANDEALRALGGAETWAALRKADPRFDRALARDVRALVRLESGADRRERAAQLAAKHGYEPGPDRLERMVRSLHGDRGLQEDVALRVEAKRHKAGRYSLYVPEGYDPLRPRPLLVALHGGGILHEKGAAVRGSAKDALALYLEDARRLGWILLCPTAVEAPWGTAKNYAFLEAVLLEVLHLWNVDVERIHLAGQGGGGDGALYWAGRKGDRFASVSIASAGHPRSVSAVAAKAAFWMYHGADDDVVPVAPARKAAASLLRQKAEFVYCELPKEGHGLAPAARRDMFRFIAPKRRRRAKGAWPVSSFGTSSQREAIDALGDPAAAWGLGLPSDPDGAWLVGVLRAGRGAAEHAARRLHEDWTPQRATYAADVRAILRDRDRPRAARVWAAWLLGRWRVPEAVEELGDTLRVAKDARLLRYCAEAVGALASQDSAQDLRWALSDVSQRFRSLKGKTVAYQDFERVCRLAAAVADAIGVCVLQGDEFFPELEENLVRHILMDRRRIVYEASNGEDPSGPRTELAGALARAYRKLGAERTLFDMLRAAVRGDKAATRAVVREMRKPGR